MESQGCVSSLRLMRCCQCSHWQRTRQCQRTGPSGAGGGGGGKQQAAGSGGGTAISCMKRHSAQPCSLYMRMHATKLTAFQTSWPGRHHECLTRSETPDWPPKEGDQADNTSVCLEPLLSLQGCTPLWWGPAATITIRQGAHDVAVPRQLVSPLRGRSRRRCSASSCPPLGTNS